MAAIEKVCELCGDYLGWKMYSIKRNHIQVCLKCREKFKGQKSILYLFKPTPDNDDYTQWSTSFHKGKYYDLWDYHYCLYVPSISGEVESKYYESTTDIRGFGKVVRRIRKLVGKNNLQIRTVNKNYHEWDK